MKTRILLAIFAILTVQFAAALEPIIIGQRLSDLDFLNSAPETPSGIPISELEQFIDNYTAEYIGTKTAGAAIAVVKNGEVVFSKAYGYAVQDETEVATDSVFEWGSGTKLLVWTSVMQLAEQGKIDLNADIRQYLPNNFLRKLRYETPVTMYNLMHHNAGWEDSVINLFYSSPKVVPTLERQLRENEPRQIYKPGTIVAYSNYGTALAGFIVEHISRMPFYQYVHENIFEPLGMTDTSIHPLQEDNPNIRERRSLIKGHVITGDRPTPMGGERIYIGLYPAGSAIGTVSDAAKFLSALMPLEIETSKLFNNNDTLKKMLSVSYSFIDGFPGIAHGFFENFAAVNTLGHGGNTAAFSSLFTFSAKERFAVVIMTNQASETAICNGLTKALFGEYVPQENIGELPDIRNFSFSGWYTMARRPATGFTKLIMSAAMMFPASAVDENTVNIGGAIFVQVSPFVFKNTGGNPLLDIVNFIGVETVGSIERGKVTRISVGYFDVLPVTAGRAAVINISIIIFILCFLYILAAVIITIIGVIKNRKKRLPSNLIKKLNIILYSFMAAVFINNIILAVRALSFSPYTSLIPHFILNIAYIVFVPFCIGFMFAKRKIETSKANMVFYTFTMVFSFVFSALLFAWEFWR
ncbi:MAG: beta-lactamase family protein [Treponema sp.]|nr:beta-lactamase family protein [Treponema sp.]